MYHPYAALAYFAGAALRLGALLRSEFVYAGERSLT